MARQPKPSRTKTENTTAGEQHVIPGAEKVSDAEVAKRKAGAAAKRATEAQILEDAGRLIAAWNERQTKRMPMLFSATIGCALKARHWFLWVRCPACHTTQSVDLRTVDRHSFVAHPQGRQAGRPTDPTAEQIRASD